MTGIVIVEWVTVAAVAIVSFALGWYASSRRQGRESH